MSGPLAGRRLLLVGIGSPEHVGAHLLAAARDLGAEAALADTAPAYEGSRWRRRFDWWVRGRRPVRLFEFGRDVAAQCEAMRPECLVTTGIAPLDADSLAAIGKIGVRRVNFLTDDPWNTAHRARWFMAALPRYDAVFTPREANREELRAAGCAKVEYLPFAYARGVHRAEGAVPEAALRELASDVIFAGAADADRLPWMHALIRAGFQLRLYGAYWDRDAVTRPYARGFIAPGPLNRAVACARAALCMVRKANRDGHSMRSYELAAMRACMLVEWTAEHEALYGPDGAAVRYFRTAAELVELTAFLLANPGERERLAAAAYRIVTSGANTYHDRLAEMVKS